MDCRLTFRRIADRRRPSPVVRRLVAALTAVCNRLERAAQAAAGTLPPPRKRRRRHAQGAAVPRRRIGGAAGCDSGVSDASAGPLSIPLFALRPPGAPPAG